MSESIKGKVAAITGAASGIGLECARALLAQGVRVVLIDRATDRLEKLCAELGRDALPLTRDYLAAAEARYRRLESKTLTQPSPERSGEG